MFIIWGTRNVRRHRGYVAEFCAICRRIERFHVQDIVLAHHVFYIPFIRAGVVGQMRTCTACGQQAFPEAGTYSELVDDANADVDTLVQKTNPDLLEKLTDRLVLEEKAKQGPDALTREERTTLIREPFVALAEQVGRRFAPGGCSNVLGALGLVVSLFLLCLWIVYSSETTGGMYGLVTAGGVVGAVLLVWALWSFATSKRRYMKRRIVPLLAQALAPLKPTDDEIAKTIEALEKEGYKIAMKLKAGWLVGATGPTETAAADS
jgi:hypothetical protein